MRIEFHKGNPPKLSVLRCIRNDGSNTWTKIEPAIEFHDLAHYVVETELGFVNAFYGLLARGFDIADFEMPRDKRPEELRPPNLHVEALQTEHIVNLLQISQQRDSAEFLPMLGEILAEKDIPFPASLNKQSLNSIQLRLKGLLLRWGRLREGESLHLQFSAPES